MPIRTVVPLRRSGLLIAIAALGLFRVSSGIVQQDSEDLWERRNYEKALDIVMPLEAENDYGMSLGYRVLHPNDNDFREFSFVLFSPEVEKFSKIKPTLSAQVRVPDGVSIDHQLDALHEIDKTADVIAIARRLKVKQWSLSQAECPAIPVQYKRYEKLQFRPPSVYSTAKIQIFMADGRDNEFRVRGRLADWDLNIHNDDHPLVRWAAETRRVLEACVASKESHPNRH